ncbi:hypothetical protein C8R46DRAFT_1345107 [Mycena filopes]|nr:hypothetical protein C8R46DRAFT_1345107 [Mycena filopes]
MPDNAAQDPVPTDTPMPEHTVVDLSQTDFACPDPLEKIFQRVEEQNERRAQQEEVLDTLSNTIPRVESSDNLKKSRRRGSISISRFGQLSSSDHVGSDGTASAGPMTPALSDIAAKSPFFQAQLKNNSVTSFASGGSADDAEDDQHVTHMHTIAPRQSISRALGGLIPLPRRLSRARSASSALMGGGGTGMMHMHQGGGGGGVVIEVKAATVEVAEVRGEGDDEQGGEGGGGRAGGQTTTVHAPGGQQQQQQLRNQASKGSLAGSSFGKGGSGTGGGWAARAKRFTKKFRRKSGNPLVVGGER